MNILIIEDNPQDIQNCEDAKTYLCNKKKFDIQLTVKKTVSEAIDSLSSNIDFAVVDMRLQNDMQAGMSVISKMQELSLRVPTVAYTNTPDEVDDNGLLSVIKKTDKTYIELFSYLEEIYKTGVTSVLGPQGYFETQLNNYYNEIFIKQKDIWIKRLHSTDPADVKKSLLRTIVYHIEQLLDDTTGKTFFEEFYLNCKDFDFYTGSILRNNKDNILYLIMSPSCDLVKRDDKKTGNAKRNVELITLCKIDSIKDHGFDIKRQEADCLSKTKQDEVKILLENRKGQYHWLPPVKDFEGGFVDFTKVNSYNESDLLGNFELEKIRIASPYMKNILSRFSSYYARQGQPDLVVDSYINKLKSVK